ncbi:e3 ubiquitin- ligase arih1 [Fusarium sporotrichioides]|uniref:E3 ubiquitin-ligase arih1 n=1 Tax=Fusarium sporotrichioides TaxID=5514 RepID=A0A395SWI6_FUSSP|nr:e3 ubiquitin- ligase arih1 [Fusarium sporotrichioides]
MNKSLILTLVVAQATGASDTLLNELRRQHKAFWDYMAAEASKDAGKATSEPLDQRAFNEKKVRIPGLFEFLERKKDRSGRDNSEGKVASSVDRAEIARDAQKTHDVVDNQDTVENGDAVDNTDIIDGTDAIDDTDAVDNEDVVDSKDAVDDKDAVAQLSKGVLIPDTKPCVICQCDFTSTQTLESPCSHHWCQECLVRHIKICLGDESRFPPACCKQALPIKAGELVSQGIVDQIQKKAVEFSTVDRTYCSDAACSTFIPPKSINGRFGRCPQCEKQTILSSLTNIIQVVIVVTNSATPAALAGGHVDALTRTETRPRMLHSQRT